MAFQEGNVVGDDRPDLDPAVAEQLTMQTILVGQNNARLNGIVGRNQLAAVAAVGTLGTQLNQAAALQQLTTLSPQEASAVDNLRSSQNPTTFAGLNASTDVPK